MALPRPTLLAIAGATLAMLTFTVMRMISASGGELPLPTPDAAMTAPQPGATNPVNGGEVKPPPVPRVRTSRPPSRTPWPPASGRPALRRARRRRGPGDGTKLPAVSRRQEREGVRGQHRRHRQVRGHRREPRHHPGTGDRDRAAGPRAVAPIEGYVERGTCSSGSGTSCDERRPAPRSGRSRPPARSTEAVARDPVPAQA